MIDPERLFELFKDALLKSGIRAKAEDRQLATDFLKIAEANLRSCRLLYEQRQYFDAVNLLQQSSEKTCKAFMLSIGLLEEKDLKKVGHSGIRMGEAVVRRGSEFDEVMQYFQPSEDDEYSDTIRIRQKEVGELAVASKERIVGHAVACERHAKDYMDNIDVFVRKLRRSGKKVSPEAVRKAGENAMRIIPVFSLAIFTSAHVESSRYPGKPRPEEYTPELGIVGAVPELTCILDKAIEELETRL
jgi:uncharacterized protein (UPF0332 family)